MVIGRPWWNSRLADTRKGASASPVAPEKYDALHFDVLAFVAMDFAEARELPAKEIAMRLCLAAALVMAHPMFWEYHQIVADMMVALSRATPFLTF